LLHLFLTSAVDGGEGSNSCPSCFSPGRGPPFSLATWAQTWSRQWEDIYIYISGTLWESNNKPSSLYPGCYPISHTRNYLSFYCSFPVSNTEQNMATGCNRRMVVRTVRARMKSGFTMSTPRCVSRMKYICRKNSVHTEHAGQLFQYISYELEEINCGQREGKKLYFVKRSPRLTFLKLNK
jgi:hypothetical protein